MPADQTQKFSIRKRIKSFTYAFNGIKLIISSQHNAWIHIVATVLAISLGFFFKITSTEWMFVILAIAIVLASETINTALEFLVDFISPEYNEKAGMIKDIAAGAVLICAIAAAVIGVIIFLPYFLN